MLMPETAISIRDKERLIDTIRQARNSWVTFAPSLDSFWSELRNVPGLHPTDVPENVITMDSRFVVRDERNNTKATFTLVYPEEADPERGRVSVLSPPGMALLGACVGDNVQWFADEKLKSVVVTELLHQPEKVARLERHARERARGEGNGNLASASQAAGAGSPTNGSRAGL